MGKRKSSDKFKRIKKIGSIAWFAGTIIAILFIVIALIGIIYTNYKNGATEDILANLSKYNAKHYNYTPEVDDSTKVTIMKPDISSELIAVLDSIEAEAIETPSTYNQVTVRVIEPSATIEDVASTLAPYASYWQIIKDGYVYHGTPNTQTVTEDALEVVLSEADNVDVFLSNFDDVILTNTSPIVLFGDTNFGKVVLTDTLCAEIRPVIETGTDVDSLVLKLQLLSEIGEYTPNMKDLYDLLSKIK